VLLSGDHVLPRISPNITLHPGQAVDPLGDFLASLDTAGRLPAREILPAHEYRFAGLTGRVAALKAHHADRLRELETVLSRLAGATTWDIARELTWSRPWDQIHGLLRRAAVGETLAHLAHLERLGMVKQVGDGVDRWHLVGTSGR
jgi:hypothetical protein